MRTLKVACKLYSMNVFSRVWNKVKDSALVSTSSHQPNTIVHILTALAFTPTLDLPRIPQNVFLQQFIKLKSRVHGLMPYSWKSLEPWRLNLKDKEEKFNILRRCIPRGKAYIKESSNMNKFFGKNVNTSSRRSRIGIVQSLLQVWPDGWPIQQRKIVPQH